MCGILGGVDTRFDDSSVQLLRHRGPDQTSLVHEAFGRARTLTFGQTRLNVVDRHDISLPIRRNGATILFNGEIYNWPEIRTELEQLGASFETKTDTEVALAAYQQWGPDCLARFNGMFALAIWDGERFFCARDRMGKKPLFYRVQRDHFEFASEIKVFPDLSFIGNETFDLLEFCPNEQTIYRDIFGLKPGHYLEYHPGRGTLTTTAYWDIPYHADERITSDTAAVDQFIELLEDSVRLRMRADVPVTLFLSGGIDSSLLAALARPTEAFTCQFSEFASTINEEEYARDLACRVGIELHIVRPTRAEFLDDLPRLAYYLEIPTGSFSVFPLYRLAKAAREGGYKVVLSGEGSDELFAGYARNEFLLARTLDWSDRRVANYSSMLRRFEGSDLDRFCRMASRSGLQGAALLRAYLSNLWSDQKSLLENMCYVETRVFLQPLLQMADRMTMANGLEARNPFLDHRIVEFAFALDEQLKYRDGIGKWIVKAAADRVLPPGSLVSTRTVKHGLPTPVNLWLQGNHSFDRKYWNALMTAECIKSLQRSTISQSFDG
jgi:asparagine synthase (glutamine-hydrolysing)